MRHAAQRLLAAVLVVLGSVAVFVVAPSASRAAPASCEYPAAACGCPTLSVSTTVPTPGERITVTGTDFVARKRIALVLAPAAGGSSRRLTTVQTSEAGAFDTSVTVPKQASGKSMIMALNGTPTGATTAAGISCPTDPTAPLAVTVLAERDSPDSSNNETATAFTGVNLLWLLLLAAVLVGVGAYATRRGRKGETVRSIHG